MLFPNLFLTQCMQRAGTGMKKPIQVSNKFQRIFIPCSLSSFWQGVKLPTVRYIKQDKLYHAFNYISIQGYCAFFPMVWQLEHLQHGSNHVSMLLRQTHSLPICKVQVSSFVAIKPAFVVEYINSSQSSKTEDQSTQSLIL